MNFKSTWIILSKRKSYFAFMLIFFGIQSVQAQRSGIISGTVVDKVTGETLPGANVFFEGTSIGASTNMEGQYILHQVPVGDYELIIKYIGYKEKAASVTVVAGKTLEINIELDYAAVEIQDVVVTAQAKGQMGAINQQLASNTIKNVVSSDRIQDVPDANAAESLSRLPGISLIRSGGEGQKVAIRGLSPKYNVIMVNGVRMQSTDRNDRSVDLNMIAPNMLSGIEVTKALTADMDADAVGGTVNLRIAKASEGFRSKFSVQNGYGSLANTYGNYKLNGFLSNRFLDNKLGIQISGNIDHFNRNSDVLSAEYVINEEAVLEEGFIPIDLNNVSITDRTTDRLRLGGGLVFDYQFAKGSIILNNFISNLSQQQIIQQNSLTLIGNQWNAYSAYNENSNAVISNALSGEMDFSFFSMDFSLSNSITTQYSPGNIYMGFGIANSEAGFTTPTLSNPENATPSELFNAVEIIEGRDLKRLDNYSTSYRDITEDAQEATLNFNVPINLLKDISGNIKFGGKYVRNSRNNDEDNRYMGTLSTRGKLTELLMDSLWTDLGLNGADFVSGMRAFFFEDPDYDIGKFLSGEEGIDDFFYKMDIGKMHHLEQLLRETEYYPFEPQPSFQYDYNYERNLMAFYTMAELNIGKYVTLYPGIRYENFKTNYNAYFTHKWGQEPTDFNNEEIKTDDIKGENWFPQMHVRVKPSEWLDIRLASSKSIIYPDYRAISPYIFLDTYRGPSIQLGNPFLEPAISQNYDIYASVYKNFLGLFTAGFFYKELDNLIVSTRFRSKDSELINNRYELGQNLQTDISTWINLDATSYVRGFELDLQTHSWYLPSFLKGIVLNLNYTHINSETTYPFQTSVKQGTGPFAKIVFIDSSRVGNMPDQPDDIFNATLGYDIGGFSARLSFVYKDNVLTGINRTYDELDSYTDAYKRWDFTAYQQLPWLKGSLQLFVNANNITNTPDRSYTSELQKLRSVEYYGMTVDLGIRYKFP